MLQRRCRHKNRTDQLKPSAACCQNCASWTDTSGALRHGETEQFSIFDRIDWAGLQLKVATRAKRSQFFAMYPVACRSTYVVSGGGVRRGLRHGNHGLDSLRAEIENRECVHVLLPFKISRFLCDPVQSRYFDWHHWPSTTAHAIYTRRMVARICQRHHRGDPRPLAYW